MILKNVLKNGRILKIDVTNDMIDKEIEEAEYDLIKAKESMLKNDSKWASVQAYYFMFHSAKALIFRKGYREKSHYCLIIALRENAYQVCSAWVDNSI